MLFEVAAGAGFGSGVAAEDDADDGDYKDGGEGKKFWSGGILLLQRAKKCAII